LKIGDVITIKLDGSFRLDKFDRGQKS